jgi:hypothetical protein
LYYERAFAHSLTQFTILQAHFPRSSPKYFETGAAVSRHCAMLLSCYSLGQQCKPGLKKPQGWIDYLGRLIELHSDGAQIDIAPRVQNLLMNSPQGRVH